MSTITARSRYGLIYASFIQATLEMQKYPVPKKNTADAVFTVILLEVNYHLLSVCMILTQTPYLPYIS